MEMALVLGQQVLIMLIYLLVGVVAYKTKIVTYEQSKGMSSLLMYVLSPCMLLKAYRMEYQQDKMVGFLFAILLTALVAGVLILSARYIFFRKETDVSPIERSSVPYTNSGYLAIPLISATLGNEAVLYASGYLLVFNVLVWTHGLKQMSGGRAKIQIKSMLTNPNLIAITLGVIMFCFNIKLPTIIDTAVSGFGNMVAPLALFIIGLTLASMNLKQIFFKNYGVYICVFK